MKNKILTTLFSLFMAFSALAAIKCGLPELIESKSPLTLSRPVLSYYYDSDNFRVWYNLTGTNAIPGDDNSPADGIPDWAQFATEYLERARALLVDTLEFRSPIPDSSILPGLSDVGGDDRTDVYFLDMEFYGMTYLDTMLSGGVGPAFLTIENDFEAASFPEYIGREHEALAVTCAHEFFHSIHYAYGSNSSWIWWMEATAVWSEERNYPDVNDYLNYLPAFQNSPEAGLNNNSPAGRFYGSCLFPMFLTANYGDPVINAIWELVPVNNVYPAIFLWANGIDLNTKELYGDFAHWNLLVGENYNGYGYSDAALMPLPKITPLDSVTGPLTSSGGAIYVEIPSYSDGGVWAEWSPLDSLSARVHALTNVGTDQSDTTLEIFGHADTIPGAWRYDGIYATLANLAAVPTAPAQFGRLLTGPAPSAKVEIPHNIVNLPPYPNPFVYSEAETLYIPFSAGENSAIRFTVWTTDGHLVYEQIGMASLGYHLTQHGALTWIPQNQSGNRLAGGIYVYYLNLDDVTYTGKIAIVNN
ncbi:hypothetical protein KAH81_05950 [bacterium]|nr:hypothetical protein [bacterium]